MGLDNLEKGISNVVGSVEGFLGTPTGAAIGGAVGGVIIGGALTKAASSFKKRRKKATKKRTSYRPGRKSHKGNKHRSSPHGKLSYHKHRHGKGHSKGIHYTKKGQPYVILSSGKAKFIKKSGARRSKKMKGGRY